MFTIEKYNITMLILNSSLKKQKRCVVCLQPCINKPWYTNHLSTKVNYGKVWYIYHGITMVYLGFHTVFYRLTV